MIKITSSQEYHSKPFLEQFAYLIEIRIRNHTIVFYSRSHFTRDGYFATKCLDIYQVIAKTNKFAIN